MPSRTLPRSFGVAMLVLLLLQLPMVQASLSVPSLVNILNMNHDFFTFRAAMKLSGFWSELALYTVNDTTNDTSSTTTSSGYTLLAPDNEAFEKIAGKYLEPDWQPYLLALVEYHIVVGTFLSDQLVERGEGATFATLFGGKNVTLTEGDPLIFNDDGMLMDGNLVASNGVVHHLNSVLKPPNMQLSLLEQLALDPTVSIFYELLQMAASDNNNDWAAALLPSVDNEGPFTLLVPHNDAFADYDYQTLTNESATATVRNHIILDAIVMAYQQQQPTVVVTLNGESLLVDSTGIPDFGIQFHSSQKDTLASDGVWHIVDTVIWPAEVFDDALDFVEDLVFEEQDMANTTNATNSTLSRFLQRGTRTLTEYNFTTVMADDNTWDCDPLEQEFAPSCCPLRDLQFEEFCISLFGRAHYNSTGMIEAHAPWIGEYGVDGDPHV
ncbi:beta-induced protein ig-h3 [Seminavis robusta]|uniref:Beta-induced protein ig-h3 n=1 Tax=Seminavis robusta TaxID=568900 RepID=A0A9N8DIZ2_9STRA|nr:beta-induced protein ig-h3 [Seminavis robusta]|eukprot:Sro167_g074600.1 beta-induced protein ig-h3 (439) ;mRNA; r:85781-87097